MPRCTGLFGEVWPYAWKAGLGQSAPYIIPNTTQVVGDEIKENYGGSLLTTGVGANNGPTGAYELQGASEMGYPIPSLKPGEDYIINARWQPLNPEPFWGSYFKDKNGETIHNPMICLLGRIVDPLHDPMFLEHTPNTVTNSFNDNIKNNNNVVTRNTIVVKTGIASLKGKSGGSFFIGNNYGETTPIRVRLKEILVNNGLSLAEACDVTLALDNKLWDRWLEGGSKADGIELLSESDHTLRIIDPGNATLSNITLDANESGQIGLAFAAREGVTEEVENYLSATQERITDIPAEPDVMSTACNFIILTNYSAEDTPDNTECFGEGGNASSVAQISMRTKIITDDRVTIAPNPANSLLNITIDMAKDGLVEMRLIDLYGRVVKAIEKSSSYKKGSHHLSVDTETLAAGTYFVAYRVNGMQQVVKLIIVH